MHHNGPKTMVMKIRSPFSVLLLTTLLLPAVTAWSDQVKYVAPSGGSGTTGDGTHQVRLTVGQSMIGRTTPATSPLGTELGFWALLRSTYIAAPVGIETPVMHTQLFRNYPNPFNPSTNISYSLVKPGEVRIDVYDLQGRRVDSLVREVKPAGHHSFTYQPRNLASGVYLVLMRADDFRSSQRIMLVK